MKVLIRMYLLSLFFATISGSGDHTSSLPLTGFRYERMILPTALVDRLVAGIEYAYKVGAARDISNTDLAHAHLLYSPGRKIFRLSEPDAILLHSQEITTYGKDFRKRNIFLRSGSKPEVLDCKLGQHKRTVKATEDFCTVDNVDLKMSNATDIMFIRVDHVPQSRFAQYGGNVRQVAGHKVLFVICGYAPRMYADY